MDESGWKRMKEDKSGWTWMKVDEMDNIDEVDESQMTWNAKLHETPNDMKCQMTWNVKWHEMSNVMK